MSTTFSRPPRSKQGNDWDRVMRAIERWGQDTDGWVSRKQLLSATNLNARRLYDAIEANQDHLERREVKNKSVYREEFRLRPYTIEQSVDQIRVRAAQNIFDAEEISDVR